MELVRRKRFRELNRKLTKEEESELTESIKEDGVQDPIVVIQGTGVLIDGFNRERIARKLGVDCPITERAFFDEDEAENWAIRKQLARRNLAVRDFKLLLGRLYNKEKKKPGRPVSNGETEKGVTVTPFSKTAEKVAENHGVSTSTVHRSGDLAKAHEKLSAPAKAISDKLSERQIKALAEKDKSVQNSIVDAIKEGEDPKDLIETRVKKKKVKPGTEGTTIAMLCDSIRKDHISPMAKKIKEISNVNGGEGNAYKETRDGMNQVIRGLAKLRKGEK